MDNNSTLNSPLSTLILIVEDDRRLSHINRHALESEGYEVQAAYTLEEARTLLKGISPDIILLDVKLPDGSGFDLCREIRPNTNAHIIFLTSIQESSGEMEGLVAGGDDYLRKPYDISLLYERIKLGLRRKHMAAQVIRRGSLDLGLIANVATIDGEDLLLSQKEFAVLRLLVNNEGQTMSTQSLYERAWGQPMRSDKTALQTAISRLRKKLEPIGYSINSVYGTGYVFKAT